MHQKENKRTVYQCRTQAQHYAERFLTMEESFTVTRLLSPSIPMFMITPYQTTSTVFSVHDNKVYSMISAGTGFKMAYFLGGVMPRE